jgi:hypothetical protein
VYYQVGEFSISGGGQVKKAPLRRFIPRGYDYHGLNCQGTDTLLERQSRTENFFMPSGPGEVKYFRRLSARPKCGTVGPLQGSETGGNGTWEDDWYRVGVGNILDRSEWVIQVVRASDNTVLFNIDSVGVNPNPESIYAQRYGQYPTQMSHTRNLPSGYAGQEVYIRISPRRWGPTPAGFVMEEQRYKVCLSGLQEYSPYPPDHVSGHYIFKCWSQSDRDAIENMWFNELISYSDSIKLATGHIPVVTPLYFDLPGEEDFYNNRYFTSSVINGITVWTERQAFPPPEYKPTILNNDIISSSNNIIIKDITDHPSLGSLNISIETKEDISDLMLSIYTYTGNEISGDVWHGNLRRGMNFVTINTQSFTNGIYLLILNKGNEVIGRNKIIIQN